MCPYSYNPLLAGKLDITKKNLNDLEDVSTAGTVDGYVLAWEQASGTWKPSAAGVGDMLISQYVTGQGTVYNASRLEENTLGSVRDHNVVAAKITSGTIGLARIPSIDDARIPNLETLSYGAAFAEGQIPNLPTTKITSGTFGLARIPSIDNAHLAGGITSDKIPALSGTAIAYPLNADTVGTTQIIAGGVANSELAASGLDISKFTVGTAGVDRIPSLPAGRVTTGTFGLARIPPIDDARIPDLETLSYGAAFADAQIPNLAASKITSGTFNVNRIDTLDNLKGTVTAAKVAVLDADKITTGTFNANRIPALPTSRITTGTFDLNRVPSIDDAHIPNLETLSYGGTFATAQIPNLPTSKITTGTFNVNRIETLDNIKGTVTAAKVAVLDADKITTGTFGLARVPTMDDAHIPDLETLSYGAAFGTAQIPSIGAYKVTAGTLGIARIPVMDDAHIPGIETLSYGAAFGTAQIPSLGAYKIASGTLNADRIPALPTARITTGTFNADRIPVLPTDRYGSAVLVSGTRAMTNTLRLKANAGTTGMATVDGAIFFDTTADKVKVYVA